jgi:hypothetical protein
MSIVEDPKRKMILSIILAIMTLIAGFVLVDLIDNWSEREIDKECCHEFYVHGMMHACNDMGYHCSNVSEYKSCYDRGYQDGLEGFQD